MTEQFYAARSREMDPIPTAAPPPAPPPPTRTSFIGAMRRYPMVVLFFLVLLAAAGVTYGIKRAPIYTASTELNVGVPNSDSQATPGYELAAETLASSYSREATSQVVTGVAGRKLGLDASQTATRLSSSAVPDSPTFYLYATGPSPSAAIALVNRATDVLRSTVNSGLQSQSAGVLLVQYNKLQSQANSLASQAGKLQARYNLQTTATTTTTVDPATGVAQTTTTSSAPKITSAQVAAAKLTAQTAQLKAQTAAQRYSTAAAAGPSANLVTLFSAHSATDDRTTVTERYGLVGGIAGLVIGAILAFMLACVRDRRVGARP